MAGRVIATLLKVRGRKRQFKLRSRAEDLLAAGHDVDAAARIMAEEKRCSEPVARTVVGWVKVYGWTRFKK